MIPRQLHFVWTGPPMPDWARHNIEMFCRLNPEFTCEVHGEGALLSCFQHAYDRIEGEHLYARRSDLIRLSVLMQSGGWYFDCDFLPIRPINELYVRYKQFPRNCFVTHGAFMGTRKWIANGIIGTTAESAFLHLAVAAILRTAEFTPELGWDSYSTKPFTELTEKHPELVHVGQLEDFYRLQERAASIAAYKRIRNAGYTRESMIAELGQPLPHALHQSMMSQLTI